MTTIKLHNTKTRKREDFTPIDDKNVRMYVCGPTVYDRAHLGNARPVIVFDVLNRLLRHVYGDAHVTYVRNFTDVDDKINARAAQSGRSIGEITAETTQWFLDDMAAVGALEPDHMPRATAYIPQMVAMIEDLIAKEHAYAAEGHVLFSVESYKAYGALSGRSIEDMIAGARVEVAPYKRNPMDFVLWKPSDDATPGWDSPWGRGRPGWHIECSAMADELLWKEPLRQDRLSDEAKSAPHVFDIHGGGLDLQFPHHEDEIAQSCCANGTDEMARYWLHNEMLQVEGKKMSKSLGNFFTVRDLLDQGVPGEVIRFVMLSTHYRKPMDWTEKKRDEAEKTLRKWMDLTRDLEPCDPAAFKPDQKLIDALADDLNTHLALTYLNALTAQPQKLLDHARWLGFLSDKSREDDAKARAAYTTSFGSGGSEVEAELAKRLDELRQMAMKTKDFSDVDALKAALLAAGCEVRISKLGTEVIAGPTFDPAKLDVLK
ncbi:cysteine--tRNA ligase [Sulfitobacter pontiacus]|jgi:cysteinyl-tRNA synthetase|uniref:cysteine--tRNA ligase n=1 Tax=Sulfitobacter pontiacus TaxID=60137 RepID=UPI000C6698AA|nr:cysteine--tRNA ligase [Sulfitobacter pontiacus]MAN09868.1 cysteine--tRNA ligase [Roseobacter sp.]HBU55596.1 cysteine--tRNA ligase [Sulfitobacter sp.]HJO49773.1 cysteine--tRNA ligase [Sulfitobacter pontiacus]|tara:strand:+ start:6018 stop:7481 length:1464 start_codon:yes stop_codon:yes gene_type:complete